MFGQFPPPLPLRRQLSATYPDPVTGAPTNIDPNSIQDAQERKAHQQSINAHLPGTGYVHAADAETKQEAPKLK